ncbi:VWA domain-containing protein [Solibacillus sp. MA9]|uniref:VWA domain-containing protein n=1 Tax=Solibacillus palustris TaxID=2908203 RepID=A0ABS9UE43_9BACL|nr:VWA domain-containing protein [Solibacillus sp. MA9]MCH7322255.1 VWA domain-containing protein [Solibacillus sp. MA9]
MKNIKKYMALVVICVLILSTALPFSASPVEAANTKISDVSTNNPKFTAIKWAVDNNYLDLFPGNKFDGGYSVKEWQLLHFISKLDENFHLDLKGKSEREMQEILYNYYGDLNIPLNGVANANKRTSPVNRGQFARIYAASNGLDLSEVQAVRYLYMNEITAGTTGKKTYEDYVSGNTLKRGDFAVFMYRIYKQGKLSIEGLTSSPTGKDNNKITLPPNFVTSKDNSVTIPSKPGSSTDDKEKRPDVYKAVKSINVAKEELIANGVDSTLITIDLRDSYGNDIPYDESLAFKVTSQAKAKISETNTSTSGEASVVYTDGPFLNVYVTAPALTKSIVDTISFEMVNPADKYYTYKNQVIKTSVRYIPKPELRVTYQVFDPEQKDWNGGNVDPGSKPLPALPQGKVGTITVPFTVNGEITVTDYDVDTKLMTGSKWETYTNEQGTLTQGDVESDEIQYGNAELKLEGQIISVWLFEQILDYMIYGADKDSDWGGVGTAKVMYTLNSEGRATYDLQGVIGKEYLDQFESKVHAVIIYLIKEFLPPADDITLAHAETVKVIQAMYERLGQVDKNLLQKEQADLIGKLLGAIAKIDVLLAGQELEQRPEGMDRYTKVIVNLVAPGGTIITDYYGTVEVTYNGKSKLVSFDTNTKDYNTGTGSPGSAVVFFDDIIYGKSEVKVRLVDLDPRYDKVIGSLKGKTISAPIFANPRFENNLCSLESEVMFVVDHSGSMNKVDPANATRGKIKQTVKQVNANPTHVYRFNTRATFEAQGKAEEVANMESLLDYKRSGGTNIIASLNTALNNFTTNEFTNKAIVLITDGYSNTNGLDEVLRKANAQGIAIHTVSVGSYKQVNEKLLKDIASETKGTYQNIVEIENLHGALQSIINSILCKTPVSNNSCLVGDTLFNNTDVRIEPTKVTLIADVNTSCTDVKGVRVIFNSPSGNTQYDLPSRGSSRYMHRPNLYEFPEFDLYTEVEFQALDASGNVITTKIHTM